MDKQESISIKNDGKFLVAYMPNGDVIPMQVTALIKNDMAPNNRVFVEVTLQAYIPTDEFEILKSSEFKKPEINYHTDSYDWHREVHQEVLDELKVIKNKWWYKFFTR